MFDQPQSKPFEDVKRMAQVLRDGESIHQMMQVTGEEGITIEDFVLWQKALFLDMAYLQQDAFDAVDCATGRDRQKESFTLVREIIDHNFHFEDMDEVRDFFTRLTGLYKNLNYSAAGSPEYADYRSQIDQMLAGESVEAPAEA